MLSSSLLYVRVMSEMKQNHQEDFGRFGVLGNASALETEFIAGGIVFFVLPVRPIIVRMYLSNHD